MRALFVLFSSVQTKLWQIQIVAMRAKKKCMYRKFTNQPNSRTKSNLKPRKVAKMLKPNYLHLNNDPRNPMLQGEPVNSR